MSKNFTIRDILDKFPGLKTWTAEGHARLTKKKEKRWQGEGSPESLCLQLNGMRDTGQTEKKTTGFKL